MTTTRTTARAEIYDAATDNGFDVKVEEGVDMTVGRRFNYRETVQVTRFVITRKPELEHLRIIGTQKSYTVVFSETDAFVKAWQFYGAPEPQPWYTRRNTTVTKGDLLERLASDNPERLAGLKAKFDAERQAHYVAQINEAQVVETDAKVARIAAYSAAVEYVRQVIIDASGTDVGTTGASLILDATLEGKAVGKLTNARSAHRTAEHVLAARKAEAAALGLEV